MRILITLLLLISPQGAGARVERDPLQGQAVYQRQVLGAMSPFARRGAWEVSRWTSPERVIGFAADELVPS
ncbi:hypothetical protein [Nonomuraea sp. NPDC046570]|uniref:hypothetical protein n=1 Tax=Nonomuraea sp. NPDC046570 TaxID=3155255 RepID=UPI003406A37C